MVREGQELQRRLMDRRMGPARAGQDQKDIRRTACLLDHAQVLKGEQM